MSKKPIRARFAHKIFFIKNKSSSAIDEEKWEVEVEGFAEISPVQGNKFNLLENMNFGTVLTEELFLFKIRFIRHISTDMRIKFNNKIYQIKRIINQEENNRFLHIVALCI